MKKETMYAIGSFLSVLLIGYLILMFSPSSDNVQVDGKDAINIAFAHTGYKIALAIGALVSIGVYIFCSKRELDTPAIVIASLLTGLFLAIMVFYFPVNIKTDPVSSGITTKEINHLYSKGLKKSGE
jgi:drug/metabolite transporter (DMT)-like permease